MTYDGYGRLKTQHRPEQDANTYTTYNYYSDDRIQQVVDARGATVNYSYDNRGLTTQVSTTSPNPSVIPVTPTVTYAYDNLGNRTSMTDGMGNVTYEYNQLSQIISENRTFAGLAGNFTINYSYHLSGKLKSVTDAFGAVINYTDDKAGRTTDITGAGFLNVTNYANNIKYRAFGGVKEMTYGSSDNSQLTYQFDNRLRISSYQSTSNVLAGGYVKRASYEYFADSKTKKVNNLIDSGLSQTYQYDQIGRLAYSDFGMKPNTENVLTQVYKQNLQYDAFSNITSRNTESWGSPNGFSANYVNGRKINSNEIYDAEGQIIDKTTNSNVYDRYKFDAAGRMSETVQGTYTGGPQQTSFRKTQTIASIFDGEGRMAKRVETIVSTQIYPQQTFTNTTAEYYLWSTVLGKILTELDEQGGKKVTNVYAGNQILAEQRNFPAGGGITTPWSEVFWKHEDTNTGSYLKTARNGQEISLSNPPSRAEYEPLGAKIFEYDPNESGGGGSLAPTNYKFGGDVNRPEFGCEWNSSPIPCNLLSDVLRTQKVVGVQVRTQGMLRGADSLENLISTKEYKVYKRGDINDDTTSGNGDIIQVNSSQTYVGSFYRTMVSPIWEMAVYQQRGQQKFEKLTNEEIAKIRFEFSELIDSNCNNFLQKFLDNSNQISEELKHNYTNIWQLFDETANAEGKEEGFLWSTDKGSGIGGRNPITRNPVIGFSSSTPRELNNVSSR